MPLTGRSADDLPFDEPLRLRFEALQARLRAGVAASADDELDVASVRDEQVLVLEEQLRQALDALEESRRVTEREAKRFRSVFDLAPDPLFVTDGGGALTDANAAADDLVGAPQGGWSGVPLARFLHPEDVRAFQEALGGIADGPRRVRLRFRAKNGRSSRGSVRGAFTGHLGQILWTVRLERGGSALAAPPSPAAYAEAERRLAQRIEILEQELADAERRIEAERRVREDAQSMATMQQRVMALVAHESTQIAEHAMAWARPLAAIASGPSLKGLRAIAWTAQMELEIAKYLLDVARIATQQLRSTFVPLDVAQIALQVTAVVTPRAEMAQVALRTAFGEGGGVLGEPTRLAQLLVGLLGVSIDRAGQGGCVTFRVGPSDEGVMVEIEWTGRALARAEWGWTLDQLGDDPAAVLGSQRSGMALFVARQLAGLHGGRLVSHDPADGAGPRITLTLPAHRSRSAPPPPSRR